MRYRSYRVRSHKRRHKYQWIRSTENNASPSASLNTIDLLTNWRSQLGISINLPDITIWRVRIKISIIIGGLATVSSNDGVLATMFVDGIHETVLSQILRPYDQKDMIYDMMYATETLKFSTDSGTPTNVMLWRENDIKARRRLRAIDDTLFLQLAASGNATITNYSFSQSTLISIN